MRMVLVMMMVMLLIREEFNINGQFACIVTLIEELDGSMMFVGNVVVDTVQVKSTVTNRVVSSEGVFVKKIEMDFMFAV